MTWCNLHSKSRELMITHTCSCTPRRIYTLGCNYQHFCAWPFPVRSRPELSTGQEGCLSEESTKHFKATEDWQRQQDDWGDREGEAAHAEEQGKKNISVNFTPEGNKERQREGGKFNALHAEVIIFFLSLFCSFSVSLHYVSLHLCSVRIYVHMIRRSFLVNYSRVY